MVDLNRAMLWKARGPWLLQDVCLSGTLSACLLGIRHSPVLCRNS